MIITCKLHGMNLIGAMEDANEPQEALNVYRYTLEPFSPGTGMRFTYAWLSRGKHETKDSSKKCSDTNVASPHLILHTF